MRIGYFGSFLREGFRTLGCDVIPLPLTATKTLQELVEATGVQPDVVFLELFGKTPLPLDLCRSRYPLAAYCIDTPLNEYWLLPLARLFDFVYVDQLSSVARFQQGGIQAKWLPLCVSAADFRPATPKKYFLSFVGRQTPYRRKRCNLLNLLQKHFPVHVVADLSKAAMLDTFAASRIVLNENFFPGFNLRFFQVLASGALLLTERPGPGEALHFQEGSHYVGYAPSDVIATIERLDRDWEAAAPVAALGQQACRQGHTSADRARTVLADLATTAGRVRRPVVERQLNEAQAKYYHTLRFGGRFDESVALLEGLTTGPEATVAQACCLLGSIALRRDRREPGLAYWKRSAALATEPGLAAALKLLLWEAKDGRWGEGLPRLLAIWRKLGINPRRYKKYLARLLRKEDPYYNSCLLGAAVLADRENDHGVGFEKQYAERFFDYALEYAIGAFRTNITSESLDAVIHCANLAGLAPEALPFIKEAILVGEATADQLALSAELARTYYDFDYVAMLDKALSAAAGSAGTRPAR